MLKKSPSKDLIKRFIGNIKENGYIENGDKILVACSGGIDSTVMLDLIHRIKDKYALELKIVHFNHCLRGKESDRDEEFVKWLAEKYNLDVIMERGKVKEFAKRERYSIQEKARILRYDFFKRTLKKQNFDKIALGHIADDQAETIIMNFIKGYGFESLKGIPEVRNNYVRPLIIFTREEICDYADLRNINYVEDSSNVEYKYLRNKIRHKLIPLIKKDINSNINETMMQWGMLFKYVGDLVENIGENAFNQVVKNKDKNKFILDINKFKGYFILVRRYILNRTFKELKIYKKGANQRLIEKIIRLTDSNKIGKVFSLSSNYKALIDRKELVIYREFVNNFQFKIKPEEKYNLLKDGIVFESSISDDIDSQFSVKDGYWDELIDYDEVDKNSLILRCWKKGDKFVPLGMNQRKKLSDFFIDEKVPNYLKKQIPILVSRDEIVWVCGYRISNKVKITEKTKKILCLKCNYN